MLFLVYGRDSAEFGTRDLDEAHQTYMDGWLPRLIGRGPTMSPDGEEHTGSVHVVEVDDFEAARRFAAEEPYASAGWYDEILVAPFVPAVAGTMWDRPKPIDAHPSTFILATWAPVETEPMRLDDGDWLFAGLLLTEDLRSSIGFAGATDLSPADLPGRLVLPGSQPDIDTHRWRRGGRL